MLKIRRAAPLVSFTHAQSSISLSLSLGRSIDNSPLPTSSPPTSGKSSSSLSILMLVAEDHQLVFNYWEPLYFLLYKSGIQTWEYRKH
ncbi:unnamed protein product [Lactuca virosa]|uniref:Uncharacterized protein n=1 Tax=Lactuca virosa TaxID=75947 RepID=A0AAU9PBE2_9ASTR|nr:unnamed protein product [Lactuca virosa]